jgi:hypothetical protein
LPSRTPRSGYRPYLLGPPRDRLPFLPRRQKSTLMNLLDRPGQRAGTTGGSPA